MKIPTPIRVALLALGVGSILTACSKPQLQFQATIIVPQVMKSPDESIPKPIIDLCSAWQVDKTDERYAIPRDIRFYRQDQLGEPLALGKFQSWFQRNQQTLPGPQQQNSRLKEFFQGSAAQAKEGEVNWRAFLSRAESGGPDLSELGQFVTEKKTDGGIVIGFVVPGHDPTPNLEGVQFYRSIEAFHKALADQLVERTKTAKKSEFGRRPTAPVVPVTILVAQGEAKEEPKPIGKSETPATPIPTPLRPDTNGDASKVFVAAPTPPRQPPAIVDGKVEISKAPSVSPDGSGDVRGEIAGHVEGATSPAAFSIVLYSFSNSENAWQLQPSIASPHTTIGADGQWKASIAAGPEYAILVVSPDYLPAATLDSEGLPKPDGKSVFLVQRYVPVMPNPAFKVTIEADKSTYRADYDIMTFKVWSERDCYFRVYCQHADGEVFQLLPNRLDPKPCVLKAGETLEFPPKKAAWEIRAIAPLGAECLRLVASATPFSDKDLPSQAHQADEGDFLKFPKHSLLATGNRGLEAVLKSASRRGEDTASHHDGAAMADFQYVVVK